jgi:hypothetical protein
LPDWNSIESTTRWSEALFWVGIAALVLVAVTELAAHVYGNRAAYLVSAHDRIEGDARQGQTEQRYSAETASLQEKLVSANAETARLQQQLDSETARLQQQVDSANAVLENVKSSKARHLFDAQTNELLKSLAPFAGQKIKVWSSNGASDSLPLGREFIAVLKMAGWVVPDAVLTGPIAGGDIEGIHVVFEGDLSNSSQIPRGIDALISTLQRIGLISGEATLYLDHAARGGEYLLKIGRTPRPARTKR